MRIILIPGLWLDGTAWRDVLPGLEAAGHQPVGLMLPGQGDGNAAATLDDQLAAVLAAIDSSPAPVTVVGHSAAGTLAWRSPPRPRGAGLISLSVAQEGTSQRQGHDAPKHLQVCMSVALGTVEGDIKGPPQEEP